jgi:predicted RNA-binding protein with PUA-like domain
MKYWLLKTEPETYSWSDLERQKVGTWDGVRNFAARNNLKKMKKGDQLFVYHSGKQRAIIGIAEVVSESFPDPTSSDPAWVAVKVRAQKTLKNPVTLDVIKRTPRLLPMKLVKIGRLSVSPVLAAEWNAILRLSEADQKS